MADVYCADDAVLGRPVAVKVLAERYAADDEVRERFTREALAGGRLSGEPNIVTIYDVGEAEGRPFIVMEYVPGGTLDDVLRREGTQPPGQALQWLEAAAQALDGAHGRGVVHRDVKPANLLLDKQGNVHVADFGIASAAGLDSLTKTGTVLGTAGYLAPEQAQGSAAGPAADRYALGVVGFELLTGSRPYASDSATAEAIAHVNAPVPRISERGHGAPPEADAVFERALAKRPEDRFSSCGEFVAALRAAYAAAAGATRIPAATAPAAARRVATRRSRALPLVVVTLALIGGGIAGAVIATGDGGTSAQRITVTQRGTTVRETVTAQPPATTTVTAQPPATTTAASAPTPSTASALAQAGYARLQAGDAAGALPLLQQAAQKLQGTDSIAEAYNDYNLAVALTKTQGCSPQVLQLLDESQAIQGHRTEINRLRAACQHTR